MARVVDSTRSPPILISGTAILEIVESITIDHNNSSIYENIVKSVIFCMG